MIINKYIGKKKITNYVKDKYIARERIDDQLNKLIDIPLSKNRGGGGKGVRVFATSGTWPLGLCCVVICLS